MYRDINRYIYRSTKILSYSCVDIEIEIQHKEGGGSRR